jgi:hypothetical protein
MAWRLTKSQIPPGNNPSLMTVDGWGGRVELHEKSIRIIRYGFIYHVLQFLAGAAPRISVDIPLAQVAAISIIKPLFLNQIFFISHPGSPVLSGRWMRDASAESALMMNLADNRGFYALKRLAESRVDRAPELT